MVGPSGGATEQPPSGDAQRDRMAQRNGAKGGHPRIGPSRIHEWQRSDSCIRGAFEDGREAEQHGSLLSDQVLGREKPQYRTAGAGVLYPTPSRQHSISPQPPHSSAVPPVRHISWPSPRRRPAGSCRPGGPGCARRAWGRCGSGGRRGRQYLLLGLAAAAAARRHHHALVGIGWMKR